MAQKKIPRTKKEFMVDQLRRAFIAKDDAMILYDIIKREILKALEQNKEVNLFDIVTIQQVDRKSRMLYRGFANVDDELRRIPARKALHARINHSLKKYWKDKQE